jgi:hypothetical protein
MRLSVTVSNSTIKMYSCATLEEVELKSSCPSSKRIWQEPMSSLRTPVQFSDDQTIWDSLKQAIASSSGFNRWQLERSTDAQIRELTQDQLVRRYLRETLETLAY